MENWSVVSSVVSILAFLVSICALVVNIRSSRRNIQLSIKQALFKTISEKVRDCNTLWKDERLEHSSPRFLVISEMVISKEISEKSFELFSKNDTTIVGLKEDYYFIFWKQLRTDLRGWFRDIPNTQEFKKNSMYSDQVNSLIAVLEKAYE